VRQALIAREDAERAKVRDVLSQPSSAADLRAAGAEVREDGVRRNLGEWLRFPAINSDTLRRAAPQLAEASPRILDELVQDARYAPYLERQDAEIARLHSDDAIALPAHLAYRAVPGLSNEMVERLSAARPATLGAASRIRGVTPAALAAILVHVRARRAA
jgi:tRNA uridine 5-carboxymethylaminomethyl modification enzyme